ncbi:hypothetical protein B0T26DRAFT_640483 [Lasiosphaeria miniovina]|uniref:Amino-acid acetyltransferase, mitochondrial n=1 Tax=Lasiosphaeria miniovina TaxID=1954250 RepID=A0AA40AUJ2_9PEZI|nr:uncharacterized protein B0T26DRAFT_640483 [Lasiosphaeria miniovina]KAK0722217.1 hypothetical protein B0T26DRAFT_640483 [Lasiosphaeria miniovina]
MFMRNGGANNVWKKATSAAAQRHHLSTAAENGVKTGTGTGFGAAPSRNNNRSPSSSEAREKREFLISVLESSATKRDAKAYLQTFGGSTLLASVKPASAPALPVLHDGIRPPSTTPLFVQGSVSPAVPAANEIPHVAIVKLRDPQAWEDALLDGVAKTITQLRHLGLLSIIVPDCGVDETSERSAGPRWQTTLAQQTDRIVEAIGRHGSPGAEVVDSGLWRTDNATPNVIATFSSTVHVGFGEVFTTPIRYGHIPVVPPRAYAEETLDSAVVDSDEVVFALARFFSGVPLGTQTSGSRAAAAENDHRPPQRASVDRVIVIDPFGGIPSGRQGHGTEVFINLEQEFGNLQNLLANPPSADQTDREASAPGAARPKHLESLRLVKAALTILPPTASALITSPAEAANLKRPEESANGANVEQFAFEVRTRRWHNPLIHNLLTDRPVYSSSLPIGRIKPAGHGSGRMVPRMPTTTLAKRGMPVTIFPDPRAGPWQAPHPLGPRLRLTDTCIDLPRLIHLINDSFSRKLDAEHYLRRVEDSLAGIIIAGEYEGGAILTWERPFGMDEETAYSSGRLVPYLDKFAVLKKSQGVGGVADIVFNAMVRDCFPGGVCWRSRKNNPVNKWYFERSSGTVKLPDSNWTMFWTTPNPSMTEQLVHDYEDVCRNVTPSWADTKQAD